MQNRDCSELLQNPLCLFRKDPTYCCQQRHTFWHILVQPLLPPDPLTDCWGFMWEGEYHRHISACRLWQRGFTVIEGGGETGDKAFSFLSKTLNLEDLFIKNTCLLFTFLPQYLLVLINFNYFHIFCFSMV